MPKKKTVKVLRTHVRRRAMERFGISMGQNEIDGIGQLIRASSNGHGSSAEFHRAVSNNITLWVVPLRDMRVAVVYDKQRKSIKTVMPLEYLDQPDFLERDNGL